MELSKAISSRRSTRSFKKKAADWRIVLEAIDAANNAPSAGNFNHLKYIVVQEKEKIKKIAKHSSQTWINEAPLVVVVISDDSYLENHYGERGRIYAKQQSGAAIQNLLLTLVDKGLSATWVGAFTDELIRNFLSIPSHIQVEAIIPIGHSADRSPKKRKKELEDTIYWEKWDKQKKPASFEESTSYPVK
jgi:nitroreductase